jgi:hypothetical protein
VALPLKFKIGLEDAPLAGLDGVSARVFRLGAGWGRNDAAGGMWQMLIPVAVVDRRLGSRRLQSVVDPTYALIALAAGAWLLRRRRRRKADG